MRSPTFSLATFALLLGTALAVAAPAGALLRNPAPHLAARSAAFHPATHRKPPDLIYHGMAHRPLQIVAFVPSTYPDAQELADFPRAIVHSTWLKRLEAAWGIPTSPGPHGRGFVVDDMPVFPAGSTTTQDLFGAWVAAKLSKHHILTPPSYQTIVVLFTHCVSPADLDGSGCGSHHPSLKLPFLFGSRTDAFALSLADPAQGAGALETTATHEIAEAATDQGGGWILNNAFPDAPFLDGFAPSPTEPEAYLDPGPGSPFVEEENNRATEAGDLMNGSRWYEDFTPPGASTPVRYSYQRIFSNYANNHRDDPGVPPSPNPYYNVTLNSDWYQVPKGTSRTVTVTGWSTKQLPKWTVSAKLRAWAGSDKRDSSYPLADQCSLPTSSFKVRNSGTFALTVQASSQAPFISWCVVDLSSSSSAAAEKNGDLAHHWYVGFILTS